MKTTALRNTVLILVGVLVATFLLSAWWISWQAKTLLDVTLSLQQTQEAHQEKKKELDMTMMKLENARAELLLTQASQRAASDRLTKTPSQFPFPILHRAKRGFNDVQAHVARGEFKGLALTDGYMELKVIFDNPAFEDMLANDHGGQRREE